MDSPPGTEAVEPVSDRFLKVIQPGRHRRAETEDRRVVEDGDYTAMLWRMVRAMEARTIANPENLTQVVALAQRLAEVVNVAVSANAERYAIDPHRGASMAECARILGISKQSCSERRARGTAIMNDRIEAAGAVKFSEARRERAAIEAAAEHAVTHLAEWRGRHVA